jgi:hypothetical protein
METATSRQMSDMFGRSLNGTRRIIYQMALKPVSGGNGCVPALYPVAPFKEEIDRRNKNIEKHCTKVSKEGRLCAVCGKDFVCRRASEQSTCSKVCGSLVRLGRKQDNPRPKKAPTKQKYPARTYTDKPLNVLIAESVLPESLKSHLLPRNAQSCKGSTVRKMHDKKRGMCWAALSICENCGDEYWSSGERSYHNAQCKSAIRNVRTCKWCGKVDQGKRNRHSKYCSGGCAQAGLLYGTRPEREIMASAAYDAIITRGLTIKQAVVDMDTSHQKIVSIMTYRCGPMFREWANDRQCAINPSGFKGKGRKTSALVADQMATRCSDARNEVAKALMVWRRTGSTEDAGKACRENPYSGSAILLKSKQYAKISAYRRSHKSKWAAKEVQGKRKSSLFKKEKDLVDAVCGELINGGYSPSTEVVVLRGSRQRVDVLVEFFGQRFIIEAKNSSRSNKIDECIGQAIRKACTMRGTAVVVLPSDVQLTDEHMQGFVDMAQQGIEARVCSELDICSAMSMSKGEWVDYVCGKAFGGCWRIVGSKEAARRAEASAAKKESRQCIQCEQWFWAYKTAANRRCGQC